MLRILGKILSWFLMILGGLTGFFILLCIIIAFLIPISGRTHFGNVAHLKIMGPITSAENDDEMMIYGNKVISEDVIEDILKISEDSKIKAVLVEINSPGGTPVASEEIARMIHKLNKPVVAWVREMGTSGAYWVAMAADHVIAHPLSITGSIGVLANNFGFEELLGKVKVKLRRQVAGKYKDIGSPFREQTEEEKEYMQGVLNEVHEHFIRAFSSYREMKYEKAKELSNGLFYTGKKALDNGMVDQLGSKEEVMLWLSEKIKAEVKLVEYGKRQSLLSAILKGVYGDFKIFFNTLALMISSPGNLFNGQPAITT